VKVLLTQLSVDGEDFIGLLGLASDKYSIMSPRFPETKALDVPALKTHVYGTNLCGLFCAGNSNGLLLPYFVSERELIKIKGFLKQFGVEAARVKGRHTSLGILIACNDNAAIVSPLIDDLPKVSDILDVEVVCMDLEGRLEVGSSLVATNKGFLAHPECGGMLESLSEIFGVDGGLGTVNYGVPYPGTGVIANSYGALTGGKTTGIELGRIDKSLGFI
jgi:translation initiation factor 6